MLMSSKRTNLARLVFTSGSPCQRADGTGFPAGHLCAAELLGHLWVRLSSVADKDTAVTRIGNGNKASVAESPLN